MIEQQNIMQFIEENTERIELLEKNVALEQRQRQRKLDISIQKQKDLEEARSLALYEGTFNSSTSVLEQEEAVRKELVDAMVSTTSSSPSNGPVVKVLTNVQGKMAFITKIYINKYFFKCNYCF